MSTEIKDPMVPICIHHAVKVGEVYGRVWDFEGTETDGIHSIFVVRYPGWEHHQVRSHLGVTEDANFRKLREFEAMARAEGRWYGS